MHLSGGRAKSSNPGRVSRWSGGHFGGSYGRSKSDDLDRTDPTLAVHASSRVYRRIGLKQNGLAGGDEAGSFEHDIGDDVYAN